RALRTDRSLAFDLAEEHEGRILVHDRLRAIRIGLEPGADAGKRYLLQRDLAHIREHATDRDIGPAVLAGIADAHRRAVRQIDDAGALDHQEERVDRIVDPQKFEPAAGERALVDLLVAVI